MKLAVSSCLLGNEIRYNGGHKRDRFITDTLSKYAVYVPFCPEDPAFGTPREAIRLVETKDKGLQIETVKSGQNRHDALLKECDSECERIAREPLCGIIFQAKSPSCGFGSAKTYLENGYSSGKTDGVFVTTCKERFGNLPMEEEARLNDPWLRENFIMQIFAYSDMQDLAATIEKFAQLVDFHTRYKYLLLAKDEAAYRELGRIVANSEGLSLEQSVKRYKELFFQTIAVKSKISKTVNVLEHMAGFFKKQLTPEEKGELHTLIEDYKHKIIPLITVIATVKLLAKKHNVTYLLDQKFLDPYPKELALRSHVGSGK